MRVAGGALLFASGCAPLTPDINTESPTASRGRFTEDCKIPAHIRGMLPEAIARATEVACDPMLERKEENTIPNRREVVQPTPQPTNTPEPTPTPKFEAVNLFYFEHCRECGAAFNVDRLEIYEKNFRVRLDVENTGEYGRLQLIMDKSSVFFLDLAQASRYKAGFDQALRDGAQEKLLGSVIRESGTRINSELEGRLPRVLEPQGRWTGWFRSDVPLPKDAVAFVLYLGNINREVPGKVGRFESYWASYAENQPFVEIKR